eukprot:4578811-Amphidinium_carterae.1
MKWLYCLAIVGLCAGFALECRWHKHGLSACLETMARRAFVVLRGSEKMCRACAVSIQSRSSWSLLCATFRVVCCGRDKVLASARRTKTCGLQLLDLSACVSA